MQFCSRFLAIRANGTIIVIPSHRRNINKRTIIVRIRRRHIRSRKSKQAANGIALHNGSCTIGILYRRIGISPKTDKAAHFAIAHVQLTLGNHFTTVIDIAKNCIIGIPQNTTHIQDSVFSRIICDRSCNIAIVIR